MGSEQRFLTPLRRAPVAPRAPLENQGRLDFEQQYRENGTFARKMTSNFQQNPEDGHQVSQGAPKTAKGTPKDGQGEPKGPKGRPGITPRIVQVDILAKLLSSRNYIRIKLRKKMGSHAAHLFCTEI